VTFAIRYRKSCRECEGDFADRPTEQYMTTQIDDTRRMIRGLKAFSLLPAAALLLAFPQLTLGQKSELGLTLGRIGGPDRSAGSTPIEIGGGTALQADYARTFWSKPADSKPGVALQLEVHLLANPHRDVDSTNRTVTEHFATLYITPGIRVKFAPARRTSTWLSVGGGYALYEHSAKSLNGQPNPAPTHLHRGALQLGSGVDVKVWKWLGFRGELRSFYTGNPAFNIRPDGGQLNLVPGGGLLFTF